MGDELDESLDVDQGEGVLEPGVVAVSEEEAVPGRADDRLGPVATVDRDDLRAAAGPVGEYGKKASTCGDAFQEGP
ncbi:hypothetical protein [Actinoallomurus soli]|uniref:hypothetical protein n=1 Tax=Actinoallomurus soli TaxID=2952535 RepID=UPI002092BEBA|nr:hypothetical protein [Actinoallomurus soli]MCO5973754.1 hypothetical protein [Actinoallomurus soli]